MPESKLLQHYLQGYSEGTLSPSQKEHFYRLLADPQYSQLVKEWLTANWEEEKGKANLTQKQSNELFNQIINSIEESKFRGDKNRVYLYRQRLWLWSAAATVVIALSTFLYLSNRQVAIDTQAVESNLAIDEYKEDIQPPDATRATITLSTGEVIYLDQRESGKIGEEGGIEVIKTSQGRISYKEDAERAVEVDEIVTNTLINPRGSQSVVILLADGTEVLLNAGSKITYPIYFPGKERRVTMEGEALFNVAADESHPFIVTVNSNSVVRVLGTQFNIRSFKDEQSTSVTLVKGSVEVAPLKNDTPSHFYRIEPNMQATITSNSDIEIGSVDTDEVTAWSRNLFYFNDTPLGSIAQNLERWYNVKIELSSEELHSMKFGAIISRSTNISTILELFKLTGTIDYKISSNKILLTKIEESKQIKP